MAELQDYSGTAASNNSASPNGWPEGMAPSGLNDSDRELAARIARERDDTQGVTASGGSSNAYTFAAARGTAAAYTGEMFVFRANHTNTDAATINVTPSGGSARGAVAIQQGGAALSGGEIKSGGVYVIVYDGTQYQLQGGARNAVAVGEFTRDLTAASGNASVTGVGFKPDVLFINALVDGVDARTSWGFAYGTDEYAISDRATGSANGSSVIAQMGEGGTSQTATVVSMDSDGFTLGWTKAGSPTGTANLHYIAFRL